MHFPRVPKSSGESSGDTDHGSASHVHFSSKPDVQAIQPSETKSSGSSSRSDEKSASTAGVKPEAQEELRSLASNMRQQPGNSSFQPVAGRAGAVR